jgi:hypothetical protein
MPTTDPHALALPPAARSLDPRAGSPIAVPVPLAGPIPAPAAPDRFGPRTRIGLAWLDRPALLPPGIGVGIAG